MIRGLMGIPKLELKQELKSGSSVEQLETYIVSKMHTPKRKDELMVNKGDVVNLIEQRNGRSFIEAFSKEAGSQVRGWVPQSCLQRQAKSSTGTGPGILPCLLNLFELNELSLSYH